MKLKLNKDGSAVVKDGKPVYVHDSGREEAFDATAAWRLALSAHFAASPVMAGLKLPADVAASFFGDAFRLEGGKLIAIDKHGIQLYSPTRHGEAANFDEAFGQLVDRYERKGMILREGGALPAPGAGAAGAAPVGQPAAGRAVTRQQFDSMDPEQRMRHIKAGGSVADGATGPAPAAPARGAKVMTRAQFDQSSQGDRAAFIKAGGSVSD
ncbi:DUF6651 domain-containing protein [Duganella sp. BuS-21]|uniref:DUF6651 domain-containing protein n=1 Tax=Duganella sp. BuS-21 TaxID=2943848 RepID=UPI0035A58296